MSRGDDIIEPPLLVSRNDLNFDTNGNTQYKCLSCNKPMAASARHRSPPKSQDFHPGPAFMIKKRFADMDTPDSRQIGSAKIKSVHATSGEVLFEEDIEEMSPLTQGRPSSADRIAKFSLNLSGLKDHMQETIPTPPKTAPSRSRRTSKANLDSARKDETVEGIVSARLDKQALNNSMRSSTTNSLQKKSAVKQIASSIRGGNNQSKLPAL
jgi:hypothetical protein